MPRSTAGKASAAEKTTTWQASASEQTGPAKKTTGAAKKMTTAPKSNSSASGSKAKSSQTKPTSQKNDKSSKDNSIDLSKLSKAQINQLLKMQKQLSSSAKAIEEDANESK